jgi:hypothetical protein
MGGEQQESAQPQTDPFIRQRVTANRYRYWRHFVGSTKTGLSATDDDVFAARYKILCEAYWRVEKVEITEIGSDLAVELASDGLGSWVDGSGAAQPQQPQFANAIDIDVSITPFTNTLQIRRLNMQSGQSQEIPAVYIRLQVLPLRPTVSAIHASRLEDAIDRNPQIATSLARSRLIPTDSSRTTLVYFETYCTSGVRAASGTFAPAQSKTRPSALHYHSLRLFVTCG